MWHRQLIIFKYFYLLIEISQSIQSNSVTTTHFCHHNTKYMNVPSKLQNTMSLCFRDSENLPWQWCRGMIAPAIFFPALLNSSGVRNFFSILLTFRKSNISSLTFHGDFGWSKRRRHNHPSPLTLDWNTIMYLYACTIRVKRNNFLNVLMDTFMTQMIRYN